MSFSSLKDIFSSHETKSQRHRVSKGSKNDFLNFLDIILQWPNIVGKRFYEHSIPLKLQGPRLVILTDHSTYSQHLSFYENDVLKKIHKILPEYKEKITKMTFQVNSTIFKDKFLQQVKMTSDKKNKKTIHPFSPQYIQLKKQAEIEYQYIEDDQIKNLLMSIYIQQKYIEESM